MFLDLKKKSQTRQWKVLVPNQKGKEYSQRESGKRPTKGQILGAPAVLTQGIYAYMSTPADVGY